THVGGLPETIDGNGWIVPSEDPSAISAAILEATSDPERLKRMGKRSREIVETRHSRKSVARALISVYSELGRNSLK
ncbi:MAG TPA: hypothetical protein PKA06_08250, partial [Gemmatales bacterium]|nr:hypothetical protein [Gemmatales bacterium]